MKLPKDRTFNVRLVDGKVDQVANVIRLLNGMCFGTGAPDVKPDKGCWWLVSYSGIPVAFAGLTKTLDNLAYFKRVGVLPEHRGYGIQRKLIKVREKKAKALGLKYAISDTTNNPHSANNLIKEGFLLYTPEDPWGFENTLYWKKDLK